MYFIEIERFGWNWLTVSSTILFIVTLWQYRGYFLQANRIWKKKSAESFAVINATSLLFVFLGIFWYGICTHSLVMTFTGGLSIPCLSIACGVWKFGIPTTRDRIALYVGIIGLALYLTPLHPGWIIMGFSLASMIPGVLQIEELYRIGTRGVIHGEWLLTSITKNVFLVIFAIVAEDWFYSILAPMYLTITGWTGILWLWPRGKPATAITA